MNVFVKLVGLGQSVTSVFHTGAAQIKSLEPVFCQMNVFVQLESFLMKQPCVIDLN